MVFVPVFVPITRWCAAAKQITIGALLPFEPQGRISSLHYMLRSVVAVFEADIHQDEQILRGKELRVLYANSGNSEPHVALSAVTQLYSEVPQGTLIGWVGPWSNVACPPTQDLIRGLSQPQISYGCTNRELSDKARFPVRAVVGSTSCLSAMVQQFMC